MPAPAPVNVHGKLNPTTPKPKPDAPRIDTPDAPRFDDALKQARAKPAKSQKPSEAQPAAKVQRSAKSSKPKTTKRAEESIDAPPVNQATESDSALPPPEAEAAPVEVDAEGTAAATSMVQAGSSAEVPAADAAMIAVQVPAPVAVGLEQAQGVSIQADEADVEAPEASAVARVAGQPVAAALASTTPEPAQAVAANETAVETEDEEFVVPIEDSEDSDETPEPREAGAKGFAEQPEGRAAPARAAFTASPSQPPKVSQSSVAPVEATVKKQSNAADSQGEQQTVAVEVAEAGSIGEVPAKAQPATPTSAPADVVGAASVSPKPAAHVENAPAPATAPPAPSPREMEFARANHERIVTDIRAQLLPKGGAMQIRLDPPQLGALQVAVHMLDGIMSVSFQTSNNEATQLLSHSLTQLKHVLESQGLSVDKLHVQQAPRNEQSSSNSNDPDQQRDQRHGAHEDNLARQDQQRKEMLRRMWRRLALGNDPLDLVA